MARPAAKKIGKNGHSPPRNFQEDGSRHPAAHPWLQMFTRDLEVLCQLEVASSFRDLWLPCSWEKLGFQDDVREGILLVDPAALRSAYLGHEWAPQGAITELLPDDAHPLACENMLTKHKCDMCKAEFPTRKHLATHIHRAHNIRLSLSFLQVCNQCVNCLTTFPTKQQAVEHIHRIWHSGRCIKSNTKFFISARPAFMSRMPPLSSRTSA